MEINDLVRQAHKYAVQKGFWDESSLDPDNLISDTDRINERLAKLMLITTEVAEAAEAVRKPGISNLGEEIADIVIRCADFCGAYEIDLAQEIHTKMEFNLSRGYKHGKLA